MKRDREVDVLPAKRVGRRREDRGTARSADVLLRTAWGLRGARGLAIRGLFRFGSFEEAQQWLRSQMSLRSGLRRPSDAADRAWLEGLLDEGA